MFDVRFRGSSVASRGLIGVGVSVAAALVGLVGLAGHARGESVTTTTTTTTTKVAADAGSPPPGSSSTSDGGGPPVVDVTPPSVGRSAGMAHADKALKTTSVARTPAAPSRVTAPPQTVTTTTTTTVQPGAGPRVTITTSDGKTATCVEQAPLPFLVRGNWFPRTKDADTAKQGRKLLEEAIRYRTEKYGYFEGFGSPTWNKHPPKFYAKSTSFMGMTVQLHERVIPALKCVEAVLKATPAGAEYKPQAAGGMRFKNTYRGFEVSNHVYGIAIDIEPDKNSCCGCVAPWPDHPLCKAKNKTVWERMAMPKSWVEAFERYGFYWLGHDVLQDTMHFEFLGDPDKVLDAAP